MPTQNLFQSFLLPLFLSFFVLLNTSCSDERLDIDVSQIEVELEFDRLDRKLINTAPEKMPKAHIDFANEYGELYQNFVEVMLREGPVYSKKTGIGMQEFISNTEIKDVFQEINSVFPETTFKKNEFENAFKHYKHYFPNDTVPEIIGYYSNFNARALSFNSTLAIGLDMYLGSENRLVTRIPNQNLPQYFKNKMSADYLVSDAMKIYLHNKYLASIGNDFLSQILSLGKIMYLLDACMPNEDNWKKMGYSQSENIWCEENEDQIWAYIINEKLLFSVNQESIANFTNVGPNTKGLPQEAPSRVGIWIGWQMIKDYMDENSAVTIHEMLQETNSKKILKHYKP